MQDKLLNKVIRSSIALTLGTFFFAWPVDTTGLYFVPPAAEAYAGQMASVTGKYVNLRSGPGTNHTIVGRVYHGDRLTVLGKQGDWYKVRSSSGQTAWIAGWLIKVENTVLPVSRSGDFRGRTLVVTAADVNLRGGPGTSYPVIGMVDKGDRLPVTAQKGNWYQVKLGSGSNAWIAGWLVKIEDSSKTASTRTAVVNATDVNLRGGPGTSYPVIGMVDKGDKLAVLSQKNNWYQVRTSNGKTAWIAGWLVEVQGGEVPASAPSNKPLEGRKEVVITATDVNVRSGPGISYQVLGMVNEGERYQWLAGSGQWYKVKLPNGEEGWIAGWLAKVEEVKEQDLPSRGDSSRDNPGDLISWLPPEAQGPMEDEDDLKDKEDSAGKSEYSLVDIDIDEEGDKTIITVEANAPLKYNTFMLSNPHRLVVNFEGVELGDLPESKKVNSDSVIKYRTGQFSDDPVISRVVLDLTGPVHYSTSTSDGGRVVKIEVKLTEYDQNVEDKVIFIDPGHGGKDPGAPGYSRRIWEDEINLDIALKLAAILKQQGAKVELSRYSDRTVDLYQRPMLANRANADIFVSIHSNANPNPAIRGTSTYYYAPYSKPELYEQLADRRRLAQCIQTEMVNCLKLQDKGIRQANFAVLRAAAMPSVLVETAYMSNPQEEKLLSDSNFRQKVAEAIARGINAYFAGK
ncbi:MAG: SH3 domain-containing protein [Desulfotomaculum sp.]|nr:SH3 domain-containing protein [Desulfotomaculum sp.]